MNTDECRKQSDRKLKSIVTKLTVLAGAMCLVALTSAPRAIAQEPKYEMGTFYVCLLIKPPNFSPSRPAQTRAPISRAAARSVPRSRSSDGILRTLVP